eukprot:7132006-Prymnesium_polylepis.1
MDGSAGRRHITRAPLVPLPRCSGAACWSRRARPSTRPPHAARHVMPQPLRRHLVTCCLLRAAAVLADVTPSPNGVGAPVKDSGQVSANSDRTRTRTVSNHATHVMLACDGFDLVPPGVVAALEVRTIRTRPQRRWGGARQGGRVGGNQRTPFPANVRGSEPWPPRASGAPRWFYAARDAAASCARRKLRRDGPSPCYFRLAARPGCSPTAKNRGGAAKPVADGQPVSIVKNVSGDFLDGGAELHHLTDDAGDRAG